MTPEREALEPCPFCGGQPKIHTYRTSEDSEGAHVECSKCGARTEATDDAYADTITAASMWNTRASAAPGEPCAIKPLVWRDHRPDSFPEPAWSAQTPFGFYNIEEVCASDSPAYVVRLHAHHFIADKDGLDEAKAAAQADYEQRIRSALVTTPQPAAGWDALRANLREAWSALALIRETVETLGPVGAMPASENLDGPTFMHEAEAIVQGIQLMALRREAPAPAEGVKPVVSIVPMELSDDRMDYFVSIKVGDREVTPHVFREEYKAAYHVALYDWLLNGTGEEPDCVEFGPKDWPARVMPARHDTAEARLREAANAIQQLDPLAIKALESHQRQLDQDGVEVGVSRQAVDEIVAAVKSMRAALSPPSGGDEATESEGGQEEAGEAREARTGLPLPADTEPVRQSSRGPGQVHRLAPSEPSPPADRREIVARVLARWKRSKNLHESLAAESIEKELLAALDGGR